MGTSSDYSGGTGGNWTSYKHAASNYARRGGTRRADKVLARYVGALGGAGTASAGGRQAGVGGAQRAGAFGAGLATQGLTPTLEALGLGHLVDATRYEVLDGLLEAVAGDGSTLEDQAVLAALCEVFEELYPEELESYEELEDVRLDAGGVVEFVERWVAAWVYHRMLPTLAEKFSHLESPELVRQRDVELRERLNLLVELRVEGRDPLAIDWRGTEGRDISAQLIDDIYEDMEELGE